MTPDSELLANFARTNSEVAFTELVRRHVNLVYSAALRMVNSDMHLAQDVTQTVFADLARKSETLSRREHLSGWLYTSACFAAAKAIRAEARRRNREDQFMRDSTNDREDDAEWENIRPALDEAMLQLKEADRQAILLRFFENRPFAEVGEKLGLNENAARMRVDRALEKLRAAFVRKGVTTTGTLASVISAHAIQTAPSGLATTITTGAVATAGTGTFTFLKIMTATQLKLGFSVLVAAGLTTAFVIQHRAQINLRDDNDVLRQQLAQVEAENENLSNRLASKADSQKLASDQLNELLRLRGESGLLRSQLAAARAQAQIATNSMRPAMADDPGDQQRQVQIRRMGNAKNLAAAAMFGFAEHHGGQFPTNWTQVAGDFDEYTRRGLNPGEVVPDTAAEFNELTNQFELTYQGPVSNLYSATNFGNIIVVREKQPWQGPTGKWMKIYGFADGHSQISSEPAEGFDAYEQSHMLISAPQ